jgi:hypothetical protein
MEPKSYDAELISAMLDGNTQPKICGDCQQANAAMTPRERHAKLMEGAEIVCRKWLMQAPIADAQSIASLDATNVSTWETSQVKGLTALAKECAVSLAAGGAFSREGKFRLDTYFRPSRIVEQLKAPHTNSIRKVDSDGDFHQWYNGSIFRRDDSGEEFIITWRKGKLLSSG